MSSIKCVNCGKCLPALSDDIIPCQTGYLCRDCFYSMPTPKQTPTERVEKSRKLYGRDSNVVNYEDAKRLANELEEAQKERDELRTKLAELEIKVKKYEDRFGKI